MWWIQAFETKSLRKLLCICYLEHKTNNWMRTRSTSLWIHRNLSWKLSGDGNLHGLGMSHTTTACPKPSFMARWRMGDATVGRENGGWTFSKSGHLCPRQNCLQRLPAEKTGKGSLLNHPSCPHNNPVGQRNELNWTADVNNNWTLKLTVLNDD